MPAYKTWLTVISAWIAGLACMHLWYTLPSAQKPRERTQQSYTIENVPQHMAIIMDGNRRWAKQHGLAPWIGHDHGVTPLKEAISCCIEQGIAYLSVYAFSVENFKRPQQEQAYLFETISKRLVHDELPGLRKQGVRINVIGDQQYFPQTLCDDITYVHEQTKGNTTLTLNLLFCYGGRHDITQATRRISAAYAHGDIHHEDITPNLISEHLFTSGLPDPDLVIRTGGRQRISNFLLYQMAYSEIYFLPRYWPDVTKDDILNILARFSATNRTYGG